MPLGTPRNGPDLGFFPEACRFFGPGEGVWRGLGRFEVVDAAALTVLETAGRVAGLSSSFSCDFAWVLSSASECAEAGFSASSSFSSVSSSSA